MNKKRILSIVMALALILSNVVAPNAFAITTDGTTGGSGDTAVVLTVEASNFMVTLPMQLPVDLAADGTITTATDIVITNHSPLGQVKVENVALTMKNGWDLADFATGDYKNMKTNSKIYGFQINDDNVDAVTKLLTMASNKWQSIAAINGTLPILYDAKLPAQSSAISNLPIGAVVFTVGWDKVDEVAETEGTITAITTTVSDQTVAVGTPFTALNLPSTIDVTVDGAVPGTATLAVEWSNATYSETTGTYVVVGTPVETGLIKNDATPITISANIVVE